MRKSRDSLKKCLGFLLILGFISLGAIGGCNNHGGGDGGPPLGAGDPPTCTMPEDDVCFNACVNGVIDSGCPGGFFCCAIDPGQTPSCIETPDSNFCMGNTDKICQMPEVVVNPSLGHTMTFVNSCTESIWIGAFSGVTGALLPPDWPNDPWEIPPGGAATAQSLTVPFCWTSGTFFARTGCTGSGETLNCTSGDCAGQLNCSAASNGTVAEFTLDGGDCTNGGGDNYDVSMVAGFDMIIQIEPDITGCASPLTCGIAGGICGSVPECPWDTFHWDAITGKWVNNIHSDDLGTCLSPGSMASFGLAPFNGLSTTDIDKLGCACPSGPPVVHCGENGGGFCCSPFTTQNDALGCIQDFGPGLPCAANDCSVPPPPYNKDQICDPFGQCDKALGRDAIWPDGSGGVEAIGYRNNIRKECCDFKLNPVCGIYTWPFDDGTLPGLSGGGFGCDTIAEAPQSAGIGYKITFTCN